jgi:hypothetical protein
MKSLKLLVLSLLTIAATHCIAQTNTQLQFSGNSPRVRFNESQFMALFTKEVNAAISLTSPSDNFQLEGTVLSNDFNADTNTRFVVINLSNFQAGTVLKLKSTTQSGNTVYKACIINNSYADAYQLSSIFDGKVVLSKFNANQIEALTP